MFVRLLAGLLGPLCAFVMAGPLPEDPSESTTPSPAAVADPWPFPKACLETELLHFGSLRDFNKHTQELFLLGVSRPCAGNPAAQPGVRLALTQYSAVGDTFVGWMGIPWRTNSIGDLKFSRHGLMPSEDTILCLSTGLSTRPDGVYAEHNRCFRAHWSSSTPWVADEFTDVPIDDPSVSVPLERVPEPGATAPAGCYNCVVDSATEPMPDPIPMPQPETVEPMCAVLNVDGAVADRRDSIRLTGSVRSCDPGHTDKLYVGLVFYGSAGGRLGGKMGMPEPDVHNFAVTTGLKDNEDAFCFSSGRHETKDGSYAVHLICYTVQPDAAGNLAVVQIPTDDPRVLKPVDTLDDPDHGGTCATCL